MSYALEKHIRAVINIPDYFMRFVDKNINLNVENKICCPFHGEDTPSFSYSPDKGVWACFGACKTGGDVINAHKKNKGFHTREQAIISLAELLKIDRKSLGLVAPDYEKSINMQAAKYKSLCTIADNMCRGVSDWAELDYTLSFNKPYDEMIKDLEDFIEKRSNRVLH